PPPPPPFPYTTLFRSQGELKVRDLAGGQDVFTAPGRAGGVTALAFSPDGKRLAAGEGNPGSDKPADVRVYDAATGSVVRTLPGPDRKSTRLNSSHLVI